MNAKPNVFKVFIIISAVALIGVSAFYFGRSAEQKKPFPVRVLFSGGTYRLQNVSTRPQKCVVTISDAHGKTATFPFSIDGLQVAGGIKFPANAGDSVRIVCDDRTEVFTTP